MLTPTELRLNQISQGLISEADGNAWYESLQSDERALTLQVLARICAQSHPRAGEVPAAIARAGLKATFTPCVLARRDPRPERSFFQITALPPEEQVKSFRLLLALFSIADQRRRETQCRDGCTHEWHNLPTEAESL
jgi:hypothetical protein